MSDYLDPANEELLKDFFVEANSQVDALEQNILVLEKDSANADAIDEIFRAAHTLKGASATVQMDELTEFTHLVEDAFDAIRSGKSSVSAETIDTLLNCIDVVKEMLGARSEGTVYSGDPEPLKAELRALLDSGSGGSPPSVEGGDSAASGENGVGEKPKEAAPGTSDSGEMQGSLTEYELLELQEAAGKGGSVVEVAVTFNEDNPMNTVGGIQVFAALKDLGQVLRTVPDFESLYEDVFHPHVTYWVTTDADTERIETKVSISDVVEQISVTPLKKESTTETAKSAASRDSPGSDSRRSDSRRAEPAPVTSNASESAQTRSTSPARPGQPEEPQPSEQVSLQSTDTPAKEPKADTASPSEAQGDARRKSDSGSILRVDSRRIDNLLNLVSETVIIKAGFNQMSEQFHDSIQRLQNVENEYREQLKELFDSLPDYLQQIQDGGSIKDIRRSMNDRFGDLYTVFDRFQGDLKATTQKFRSGSQNLGRVTGELQEGVMRIRMVPISQIFSRFPRLVRDLNKSLNKSVKLEIEGEDTELDKSVIEDLLDPLIHCARNSIDHGIESSEERREAGKADDGTLTLRASNEGNMILIEVSDDGRGIDVDKVREKAIDRGVIHPSKNLSDVEAFNLIFDPGFSTAQKVTNVSGRGVGLDVVQQQIKKLNGSVSVWSEKGAGTRFTIKIPLTLAIIQGLLVRVGKEMYAIPITSVLDSHRIKPSEIKLIDNYEVFNVRDDVVSLIRLNRLFRIETEEHRDYHFVVVVGSGDRKMGLIVDELIGEEDVVIKPLRDHYTNVPGIAGANITGDGTVSLIIDVSQLLDLGLQKEREQRRRRETPIRRSR